MTHDSPNARDLLALVESHAVRLLRLDAAGSRSLVRVPLGGALTVEVAARVADALLDAQPADRVLVMPHDPDAASMAARLADALDARHPGDTTAVLPDLQTLLALRAGLPARPSTDAGRRLLPRPSAIPHTVRLSPPTRL